MDEKTEPQKIELDLSRPDDENIEKLAKFLSGLFSQSCKRLQDPGEDVP